MNRGARRPLVYLAAAVLVLTPGCRAAGQWAYDAYALTSTTFTPNPVSMPAYFGGLVLGFIVGLPFCLLSWPLTVASYPREDGDEYFISAALAPAIGLGTFFGSVLATPVYPIGAAWLPNDQDAPPGPNPPEPR